MIRPACLAVAGLLAGLSAARAQPSGSATLGAVRARGAVLCGVSGTNPGFAFPDSQGVMRGSEADFCRAVAAATLGDAGRVKWVVLTSTDRFTALQSGEVDLLDRTATWTLTREANLGLLSTGVTFYDGTGFMVQAASGVKSAAELNGATVCVLSGTSPELAVADYFRKQGMQFTPVLIDNVNELRRAFTAGRCDAYSTDASALASTRFNEPPARREGLMLPEIVSKEPLGPLVRKGDDKWFDIVRWTHFAMLAAKKAGLSGGRPGPRARAGQSLGVSGHQAGGQLRRGLGPHHRPARHSAHPQPALEQGRAAISAAAALTEANRCAYNSGHAAHLLPA